MLRKRPLSFAISSIVLSISCCHLVVYYPTKPLWNCVSASQICCSGCCSLSLLLSVWLYVENFNLPIPHDHICRCSLEIQCCSLKLHFRTDRSLYISLVSSKPKQVCIKKLSWKRTSYRGANVNKRQAKGSNSLRLNFYVVLQPATCTTLLNMNELKGSPHKF